MTSPASRPSRLASAPTMGAGIGPGIATTAGDRRSADVAGMPGSDAESGSSAKVSALASDGKSAQTATSASTLARFEFKNMSDPPEVRAPGRSRRTHAASLDASPFIHREKPTWEELFKRNH